MAGQANDTEKLPWLEPYREPEAKPARAVKPAKTAKPVKAAKAANPAPVAPVTSVETAAVNPARPRTTRGVPLAAWLATGVVVVAIAAGGGYWAGNRNAPAVPASSSAQAPAPTVTIPVAKVDPIPMPEVEAPVTSGRSATERPARKVRKTAAKRSAARTQRIARADPPPRPKAAPPMPKMMSVSLIPRGSAAAPGSVVDLGRYLSPQLADSAFRTTAGRYPYLANLKRVVVPLPPVYGQPRHYALQVGAKSARQARQLCDNLKKIGRPCVVR